ncbi:MAG: protease SohB [Anaerobiospirillum sp.]|nr:protease SohB [Anaerobiospirillum sp.]
MIDFVLDIFGFLLKTLIVVGVVILPLVVLLLSARKKDNKGDGLNEGVSSLVTVDLKKLFLKRHKLMTKSVKAADPERALQRREQDVGLSEGKAKKSNNKKALKSKVQKEREERNELISTIAAKREAGEFCPRNLFVLDFRGSTKGHEFKDLRLKIDAILEVADEHDEVIVNLCSPGGLVNSYGLCASQLERLRSRNIFLTVTVDEVAASGGYLMACVANKIVAAPFAYVGSIGVIAGIPNFRRVLNKYDVDYEQITAGKFKRTLSVFGENTEEGRQKFKEELEAVHERFKEQVLRYRPQLDVAKVTTGEHWLALDAKELGLVDEIATSDEYIAGRVALTEGAALKIKRKKTDKRNLLQKYLPFLGRKGALATATRAELEALDEPSFLHLK